jgi:hypothetical protein
MDDKQHQEVKLKDLILAIIDWKDYYLSKWKSFVIAGLICALLGLLYAFLQPRIYSAEITFALEEKTSSVAGYAGLASQFGIDLSKGEGGAFTGDNILELFKSQYIIENALLSEVNFGNKRDLLINKFIEAYHLDEAWAKREALKNVKFKDSQPRKDFTRVQDSLLHAIAFEIKSTNLSVNRLDKKLSIMSIKVQSQDELFSKEFVEILAKNVHEFYINTKTKKTRSNVDLLQARVDSVKMALDNEMFGAASAQDRNMNLVMAKGKLTFAQSQIKIQLLTALYGELIKNLELTKLTLMREEPLIQIIDRPILPLPFIKAGKLVSLIFGGMTGGLFMFVILTGKRIYKQTMLPSSL